jgi:hypothetical protein
MSFANERVRGKIIYSFLQNTPKTIRKMSFERSLLLTPTLGKDYILFLKNKPLSSLRALHKARRSNPNYPALVIPGLKKA